MSKLEKGKTLFAKKEYAGAIIELNSFLKSNPNNADALYTRAMCYRKTDKYSECITDLNTILKRLPNEPSLLCDRGIAHFKNKNIEEALKDMDKAVELEPNNPFRYSSRAYIKAKVDVNGAMADYQKAIELDPKDEISLNNLGLLQENSGKMKAAKKNFNKSNQIIGYNPEKRKLDKIDNEKSESRSNKDNSILKIMLGVFTSKSIRKEYFNYLSSLFR